VAALARSIELARSVAATAAMKPFVVREVAPGRALKGEELANFIRNGATTYFHSSGACRMGKDDKAVVDSQLRVNGVHNLRIADEHAGRHRRRPRRPRLLPGRRTWLGHGMVDLAAILDPWVSSSAVWCRRAAG